MVIDVAAILDEQEINNFRERRNIRRRNRGVRIEDGGSESEISFNLSDDDGDDDDDASEISDISALAEMLFDH